MNFQKFRKFENAKTWAEIMFFSIPSGSRQFHKELMTNSKLGFKLFVNH